MSSAFPFLRSKTHVHRFQKIEPQDRFLVELFFVDRAQLEKAASTLPHAEAIVSDTDLSACSPFLRFAVGFSLKHGDLINQWGQESVQEQIKDEWDAANPSDPMSKKMAERMSYVVRVHDPAAIAIGATASAGRKKG